MTCQLCSDEGTETCEDCGAKFCFRHISTRRMHEPKKEPTRYTVVVLTGGSYEIDVDAASEKEARERAVAAFHAWNDDTDETAEGNPSTPVDSDVLTEAVSAEPIRAGERP